MSQILFLVDFEEGHILSTFALSKALASNNHEVIYLGLAEAESMIRAQGFRFFPVLQDIFPQGAVRGLIRSESLTKRYFSSWVDGRYLDPILRRLKPDAAVMFSYYYLEGLTIHFKYHLPLVFVTPNLRVAPRREASRSIVRQLFEIPSGVPEFVQLISAAGIKLTSLESIADIVLTMPELVMLPKALDPVAEHQDSLVFHVGTGVDLKRTEHSFNWQSIDAARPLIYCSLGSQCDIELDTSTAFFKVVLEAFAARPDWQLILSVGKGFDLGKLSPLPSNVLTSRWVPQIEVLSRASLMITHGGLGTVRECLLLEVPMLVFPLMRDQFDAADLVVRHQLGAKGAIHAVTPESLRAMIAELLDSQLIKQRLSEMARLLRQEDRISLGAEIIAAAADDLGAQADTIFL